MGKISVAQYYYIFQAMKWIDGSVGQGHRLQKRRITALQRYLDI